MNTQAPKQEILLFTITSFAKIEFCEKGQSNNEGSEKSIAEKLEKLCWNGLLAEMLPCVLNLGKLADSYYIWQIDCRNTFLYITLSPCFSYMDIRSSINPYHFQSNIILN
jgi:hypothetical protein